MSPVLLESRVKILIVHAHPLGFRCGEHAVKMDFDGLKASGVGASFTKRVVGDDISASCYLSLIGMIFFRLVGAHGASMGDSATSGNLVFVDEEDGVGAFDIARRKTLS